MTGLGRGLFGAALALAMTFGVESRASACSGDSDCPADAPICDSTSHACRACTSSLDCSVLVNVPICVLSGPLTGQCVACVSAGQCTGGTPDCDVTIGVCVACLLDVECGGPTSGSVCDNGVCEPGCRGSGGNMCPSGETCALDAGTIGQCVGGDGGASGDGGGAADAGRSGDGGEADGSSGAEAGASTDGGGSGDAGTSGEGGAAGEGGIAGDGGGAGDGGLAAGDGGDSEDDGGGGLAAVDGSFADGSGNGSNGDGTDNGGFIDGAGCSCTVRGGASGNMAGAMFGVVALLGTVRRRRRRARGRRMSVSSAEPR